MISKIMKDHDFFEEQTGGGCTWFAKKVIYKGKPAKLVITGQSGASSPVHVNDPITVGMYDEETGESVIDVIDVMSSAGFLNI